MKVAIRGERLAEPDGVGDERQDERSCARECEGAEHEPVQVRLRERVTHDRYPGTRQPLEGIASGEEQEPKHDQERVDDRDRVAEHEADRDRYGDQHDGDDRASS